MNLDAQTFFISYSRADYAFVLRLTQDLKAAGANVWLDQVDIELSENWDSAIERALVGSPRLLAILSPASVASNNVMDEVSFALEEKKIVIPILYQPCEIPFRLRRLQRMDFTGEYEVAMQILLSRLRLLPAHAPTPSVFTAPDPPPPAVAAPAEPVQPAPIPPAPIPPAPISPAPISPAPISPAPAPPAPAPVWTAPAPAPPAQPPAWAAAVPAPPAQPVRPPPPTATPGTPRLDILGGRPKPALAAALAFFPGFGALYNKQYKKTALFFVIYIVAMLLAQSSSFFGLIYLGVIVYMMYEAFATAKKHRDGITT